MEQLQFRSLLEHPEYRESLLENVKNNSDWGFLYGWLEARLAELGQAVLPQVYAVFDRQEQMVGYYVLSAREVICHPPELFPWLGIILVFDPYRGRKYSPVMIADACQRAKADGFSDLYLVTEHEQYYERFGFTFVRDERYTDGSPTRLYHKAL